jgi:peroxiredoxin Q/BCP
VIAAGDVAPNFAAPIDDGSTLALSALRGRWVVMYFYPKDDTSGCTAQACDLRDQFPRFEKANATILGLSPDSVASHKKFKAKYELPFTLIADTDHAIADAYGVWKEKSMYGRKYWGNERTTFLIDPTGRVARVFPKVKPEAHAAAVQAALAELT